MKVVDWIVVMVVAGLIFLAVAICASADMLEFSCTADPAATGYRIKSAIGLPPASWTQLAENPTCAFSVQRPTVRTFYKLCAFNAVGETCRETSGFWSLPDPGLAVGGTTLR